MNYDIDMHPNSLKALALSQRNKRINIQGQRFGRLKALRFGGHKKGRTVWVFECDCGMEVAFITDYVRSGKVRSCGCLRREITSQTKTKHGMSGTKFYQIWHNMQKRCYNKKSKSYKDYGGRDIKIEWKSFEDFKRDMFPTYRSGLFIERIDNNGNYCKLNCRWATKKEQNRNTRNSKILTFNGRSQTLAAWTEETGIGHSTIIGRLKSGWPLDKALTVKPKIGRNQYEI